MCRQFDTSEAWLEKLTKSRVKRVVLLGEKIVLLVPLKGQNHEEKSASSTVYALLKLL